MAPLIGIRSHQGTRPNQSDAAAHRTQGEVTAAAVMDGYGTDDRVPAASRQAAHTAVHQAITCSPAEALRIAGEPLAAHLGQEGPELGVVGALVRWTPTAATIAWTGD